MVGKHRDHDLQQSPRCLPPPPPQTAMSVTSHEVGDLHLKVKTNTSRREGSSWRNERCEFLPLLVVPVQLQQADLVMQ